MQILLVFLRRIHSQSYFLKKLFLGLGMDYVLICLTNGCDCINVSIQIRNMLLTSATKLFPLSMLWLVSQSTFKGV